MTNLHDELEQLSHSHPVPSEQKLARRLKRIERMTNFYRDKAELAEDKRPMFLGFVSALVYASSILRMYRKLTKRLNELSKDDEL